MKLLDDLKREVKEEDTMTPLVILHDDMDDDIPFRDPASYRGAHLVL